MLIGRPELATYSTLQAAFIRIVVVMSLFYYITTIHFFGLSNKSCALFELNLFSLSMTHIQNNPWYITFWIILGREKCSISESPLWDKIVLNQLNCLSLKDCKINCSPYCSAVQLRWTLSLGEWMHCNVKERKVQNGH